MCVAFGVDGSFMSPFSLRSDNVYSSLMSQVVPPTICWTENCSIPALTIPGLRVDLAWFQCSPYSKRQFTKPLLEKANIFQLVKGCLAKFWMR
ncbi:hypothetical protein MKW98_030639 [Papaver atlanticum]|uniref:Uncharacterized protein n=1 Tax=Papaver atlanticum TaxID=357466 RepID=A0AAD4RUB1_9MAGN|nr:hypothetical protein MKW98_030639 [Papaver atlanticum]